MPAFDERTTEHPAARGASIADLEARLAQFGRMLAEIRAGLPERHAQALSRIEQGIGSLAQRVGTLGREGGRGDAARPAMLPRPSPSMGASPATDEPWDPQSAEELMRVYEAIDAHPADAHGRAQGRPWPSDGAAAEAPAEPPARDAAWLETRFAELATLFERSLAQIHPAQALADLDRRLDAFERRLESALTGLGVGRGDLKLIDAHLVEFAGHFEALRQQLGRLDGLETELRELAQVLDHTRPPAAGEQRGNEERVAKLIESAAEHAAEKVAQSLPGAAGGAHRMDALEALLRDHVADGRRSAEASASVLERMETALLRIADRVEDAMEPMPSAASAGNAPPDPAELEIERDRLAEAYANGARVLGQTSLGPVLDATDYVASGRQRRGGWTGMAAEPGADDGGRPDENEPQELRAYALHAKLKTRSLAHAPAGDGAGAQGGLGHSLGQGRVRISGSAKARSYRASLLFAGLIALLFGAGFVAVNSMLATSAPARARRPEPGPPPGARASSANPGPADARKSETGPTAEPAARAPIPEPASDAARQSRPPPTPRLEGLPTGAAPLPAPEAESAAAAGMGAGELDTLLPNLPAHVEPPPAQGEAGMEIELAKRFEEGAGAPVDPRQAFAWYERLASRGLAAAQFQLAVFFEEGTGVNPDRERAKVWYGRAAQQGHLRAMHNLGVLLAASDQPADHAGAARWLGQAAQRGLLDSQFELAVLYESGRGVAKDLAQAYLWFALAARSGEPAAVRRLEQVAARLNPVELASAKQQLAGWRPLARQAPGSSRSGPTAGALGLEKPTFD